jgi:hypothetical protein
LKELIVFQGFSHVALEVALAVLPMLLLFLLFQIFLKLPRSYVINIIKGFGLAFVGLALFLQGVKIGFLPFGQEMGQIIGSRPYAWSLIPIGFVLGFVATLAEPAVRILSSQVERASTGYISEKLILYTLSLGVALFTALGMAKVYFGISFYYLVVPGYLLALLMLKFSNPTFIAIAFDSGGVATGPMTVTLVMAMAVGASTTLESRDPVLDGFGLIALVALAPILLVMALGFVYREEEDEPEEPESEALAGEPEHEKEDNRYAADLEA